MLSQFAQTWELSLANRAGRTRYLDFQKLNKMNIIEQDSISLIVDVTVPRNNFTDSELKFIEQKDQHYDTISGKQIWELYNEFFKNFQGRYTDRKINTKIWSSVLSKFMINIRNSQNEKILVNIDLSKGILCNLSDLSYSDYFGDLFINYYFSFAFFLCFVNISFLRLSEKVISYLLKIKSRPKIIKSIP